MLPSLSTVAGRDYIDILDLRLCFMAEIRFHLVTVSIINDNIFETFQESFSAVLTLDSPSLPAINISPSQAEITIEDDDGSVA